MPAFVTITEYETFLGRTFTAGTETNQATQALELATSFVQNYTGQHIFQVVNDEVELWPRSSPNVVILPEMPVTSVVSVIDSDGLAVTGWTLRPGGVLRLDTGWNAPVTVTYTHGYAVIPDDIKLATMRTASAFTANPSGNVRQESIGSYSVTYGSAGSTPSGIGGIDQLILARYRMPMAA